MKHILIHLILLVPTLLEVCVIDDFFWKRNVSDKPASTIIRAGFIGLAGMGVQLLEDNSFIAGMMLSTAYFFAFFNYLINWRLGEKWHYLGSGWFDSRFKLIPEYFRLFIQFWVLITCLLLYYYLNGTIYQEYSTFFDFLRY